MVMCSFPSFYIYSGRGSLQKSLPAWDESGQAQANNVDPIFAWTKARTSELDVINITVRYLCVYSLPHIYTELL